MRDILGKDTERIIYAEKRLLKAWKELEDTRRKNREISELMQVMLLEYTKLGYINDNTILRAEKIIKKEIL